MPTLTHPTTRVFTTEDGGIDLSKAIPIINKLERKEEKAARRQVDEGCDCQRGKRTTRCQDCMWSGRDPICKECFIDEHEKHLPFHWAHVWDDDQNCFVQRDISALRDDWALQLGHVGRQRGNCLSNSSSVLPFRILADNGIHHTRVKFCKCDGAAEIVGQLIAARLFPGHPKEPTSAIRSNVLDDFQTKKSAYNLTAEQYMKIILQVKDG